DLDRPRPRLETMRFPRRIVLVDAELVEVVVGRRRLELGGRVLHRERLVALGLEWRARRRRGGVGDVGRAERDGGATGDERAAVQIERLVGDVGRLEAL